MRHNLSLTCFFLVLILTSCDTSSLSLELDKEQNPTSADYFLYSIDFVGEPIKILSTEDKDVSDADCNTMGYFNIVKVKEDLFYLYYIAVGKDEAVANETYDLCMAYSSDGFHYTRGIPGKGGNIVMPGVIEQSVFMIPDENYPFRLIGNEKIDGKYTLCMWKSLDGINFFNRKVLLTDRWHDTQNVGVVRNGYIKVYTRLWNPAGTNRQVGVAYFDYEGNQITSLQKLAGDYLYNAAPLIVDEKYEIILPTFLNNKEGLDDHSYIKAYLVDGLFIKEINCSFNSKLSDNVGWVLVSPYLVNIGGKNYISFYTANTTHDADMNQTGRVVDYYLLETVLTKKTDHFIIFL